MPNRGALGPSPKRPTNLLNPTPPAPPLPQARAGKGSKKGKGSRSERYKAEKKGPKLDARMRKDRRGQDAAKKRAKKSGRPAPGVKKSGPKPGKNRRR